MKKLLFVNLLFWSLVPASAQKVKYKDLLYLLKGKQYEDAEPHLKRYIRDSKKDHPNAFLFMGFIYQDKAEKTDYLRLGDPVLSFIDSALFFLDKANKTITEKEIKSNKEEYDMYLRRDLRAGDFSIKISDIQLDISDRSKRLRERRERVKVARSFFVDLQRQYREAAATFRTLQDRFALARHLYLRSDEATVDAIKRVQVYSDSLGRSVTSFRSAHEAVGKTVLNPAFTFREIRDFAIDGKGEVDFLRNDVIAWDYGRWASETLTVITRDIVPLRESLISYDKEINQLRKKVAQDSISIRNDLTQLVNRLLLESLKKYDPQPLPLQVFTMKLAELAYANTLVEHRQHKDTLNVPVRLQQLQQQQQDLARLDSVAGALRDFNLTEAALDYQHFITNAYGNLTVLRQMISTMHDYAQREKRRTEARLIRYRRALQFVVDGADSIPLVAGTSSIYHLIQLAEEKYTTGFAIQDSVATGYFYSIAPSRRAEVKARIALNGKVFVKRNLPVLKGLSAQDEQGQIYFTVFYSMAPEDGQFVVSVSKIYRTDGLAWTKEFLWNGLPQEVTYSSETGELSVRLGLPDGTHSLAVIDKSGKQQKH